jgi:hypothetical protein
MTNITEQYEKLLKKREAEIADLREQLQRHRDVLKGFLERARTDEVQKIQHYLRDYNNDNNSKGRGCHGSKTKER